MGQIYMRTLNWLLCAGCLVLIFTFQSSSHLASAYGLAVSGVMLSTSLAMIPLAVLRWRWSVWRASLLFGGFAGLEGMFLLANTLKFLDGGFVPIAIGLGLFVAMSNYHWGRHALLAKAYAGFAAIRDMRWFLALKQRLIDHGGVLHERPGPERGGADGCLHDLTSRHERDRRGPGSPARLSEAAWHRGQKSPPAHH